MEKEALQLNIFEAFKKGWALVTAGTADDHNTMTVSWGSLGTLWGKDVATIYVKPIRRTHDYLDKNEYFTVSFYPESCRSALMTLGTKSGRDGDKEAQVGFRPVPCGRSVTFAEAKLTLLCKKIYRQDMERQLMPEGVVQDFYTPEEPHTMYIGEVLDVIDDTTLR